MEVKNVLYKENSTMVIVKFTDTASSEKTLNAIAVVLSIIVLSLTNKLVLIPFIFLASTVDYAILLTNRFREEIREEIREGNDSKEAG